MLAKLGNNKIDYDKYIRFPILGYKKFIQTDLAKAKLFSEKYTKSLNDSINSQKRNNEAYFRVI